MTASQPLKPIRGRPYFDFPATEALVAEVEGYFGIKLPPVYREFLLARNGWEFERNMCFDFDDGQDSAVYDMRAGVRSLYGVAEEQSTSFGSLIERRDTYFFDERVPNDQFCCIGSSHRQSVIAICVAADDYGAIYKMEDNLEPCGPPSRDELRRVCNSFPEFWNGLREFDPVKPAIRTSFWKRLFGWKSKPE